MVPRPEPAPIWQNRFYDFNVRTEQKQIAKLRYIHRNLGWKPVKRRLVGEQWEWSSFRSYLYQYQETGLLREKSQEWPMEIKARPAVKFGDGRVMSRPLIHKERRSPLFVIKKGYYAISMGIPTVTAIGV
jgi:hypothetical protein